MKKYLVIILFALSMSAFSVPTEIISNVPADIHDAMTKADGILTLEGMMSAIVTARNVQEQLKALQNLRDFQHNPSDAINQVNTSVNGLLKNFNQLNNSHIDNLSSLISTLSSSITSEGMSLKLATASNMQLTAIHDTLQQIQAQQQAVIAYKQAEIEQKKYEQKKDAANKRVTANAMMRY